MEAYYVAGIQVGGNRCLSHANVDVKGFWRNIKGGGRVWVQPFQRTVQGMATSVGNYANNAKRAVSVNYSLGKAGLTPMKPKSIYSKAGYAAGQVTKGANQLKRNVSNAATTVGKKGKWIAGVNKMNAKVGYSAGKYGWDRQKLVGNSLAGNAGYVAGRITRGATKAAENVGRAANTVKEWGSQQLNKAKDFISNLFSSMRAGKAAFNVGAQGHETRGGNAAVKAGNLLGRAVSALKQAAPKALQAGQTFMETVFKAVGEVARKAKIHHDFKTGKIGRLNKPKQTGTAIDSNTRRTVSGRYIPTAFEVHSSSEPWKKSIKTGSKGSGRY